MMKATDMIGALVLFALYFLDKCHAGDFCGYDYETYCEYGCCSGDVCCDEDVTMIGLILGLVFGIGGTIVIVVVIICICRRRRSAGFVYRQQIPPTPTVIVAQNHSVTTSNMPPGVAPGANQYYAGGAQRPYGAYPQPQPMPQPYPQPQAYAQGQPQAYAQGQPQAYAQGQPQAYAQGPPPYDATMQKPQC